MKKSGIIVIAILAIVAIAFASLYFTNNGDLTKTKNDLTAKVNELTDSAAKAADDAAASLKAVTDEKDALAAQVETLTADC